MSNALSTTTDNARWLTPQNMEAGLKLADMMAKAKLVPEHLRGSAADCLLVISQAARWGMDPFAVAQATAVVRGKLCYEGKLVAAVLAATGSIEGRLAYEFSGEGEGMAITVTGTPRGQKPCSLKGSVRQWRTENDNWKKDPQSMLVYRGTRQWARLYCPEAVLGVHTPDEIDPEVVDVTASAVVHPAIPEEARTAPVEPKPAPAKPEPKAEPKPAPVEIHPALAAGNKLWATLQQHEKGLGTSVLNRLAKLNGADAPKAIAADRLDQFAKDVAAITALGTDREKIEQCIAEWEGVVATEGGAK